MKVYVLTSGSYSDYTVHGVVKDKELAEKIGTILGYGSEEYELITDISQAYREHWYIVQLHIDGTECRRWDFTDKGLKTDFDYMEHIEMIEKETNNWDMPTDWSHSPKYRVVITGRSKIDYDHALKSAYDKLAVYK